MEKDLQLYLHFIGNTDKTDQWNSEFSYYFSMVAKQILGVSPVLYSNVDVPAGKQFLFGSASELNEMDLVIFVLNARPKNTDFEYISSLLPEISYLNIFIVLRTFSHNITIPDEIKSLPTYHFYENNPYSLEITEFSPDSQGVNENDFWVKMTDLIYDVKIKSLADSLETSGIRKTIYLAEVSADQIKNRERLLRELQSSGYQVYPEKPLPGSLKEFEAATEEQLSKCTLSIHIMGESYGDSPDGSDYSYVEIQNRIYTKVVAEAKSNNAKPQNIQRIIWYSPVFDPFDDKQTQYLKRLKKEILNQADTEIIHSSLYELKDMVDKKLSHSFHHSGSGKKDMDARVMLVSDNFNSAVLSTVESKMNSEHIEFVRFPLNKKGVGHVSVKYEDWSDFQHIVIVKTGTAGAWLSSILSIIVRSLMTLKSEKETSITILTPGEVQNTIQCSGVIFNQLIYGSNQLNQTMDSLISRIKP